MLGAVLEITRSTLKKAMSTKRLAVKLRLLVREDGVFRWWCDRPPRACPVSIAWEGGEPIGWAIIFRYPKTSWSSADYRIGWYVHPDHREKGVARALSKALLAKGPAEIKAQPENALVHGLLVSNGYSLRDPGSVDHGLINQHAIYMRDRCESTVVR